MCQLIYLIATRMNYFTRTTMSLFEIKRNILETKHYSYRRKQQLLELCNM